MGTASITKPWVGHFLPDRLEKLAHWVTEREKIRKLRAAGQPKPWTADPILQSVRFCNVRRMDDKVSVWLLENWYPHNTANVGRGEILAAAALARLVNWPEALEGLRGARSRVFSVWDYARAKDHFEMLKAEGKKVFTGAYIINAAGGGNKVDIVLRQVNTFYKHGELLMNGSMEATHHNLQRVPGIGSFIAGQMVADLRHVWPGEWQDRGRWAPLGPGSLRGINWLLGWNGVLEKGKGIRMTQADFERNLQPLLMWFQLGDPRVAEVFHERKLEAHDIQNCLCEYDKYMRLFSGTGKAKNKYPGV